MAGFELLGESLPAVRIVGSVLAEAVLLYVGYGAVTRAVAPFVRRAVGGE